LASLEELAIDQHMATAAGFEALVALKRLRAVHIDDADYDETNSRVSLPLDNGGQLAVLSSELDGLSRAMESLRRSHPRIVIDARYVEFEKRGNSEPPWDEDIQAFVQRWLYER
jgi:hypothetical protein